MQLSPLFFCVCVWEGGGGTSTSTLLLWRLDRRLRTFCTANVKPYILLELAKRLDVADLLSLLSLCRITRELQFERTLWLDALIRIREVEMQPLPISTADSVNTLSLPELQNVVRRADRLIKNFKSEKPRPFRIGNFSVEAAGAIIFFIPGANLIVAHTNNRNCVAHLDNERDWFHIQSSALHTVALQRRFEKDCDYGKDFGWIMAWGIILD
ncbi:hypothetical protein B0H13DRAFT_1856509 [Mycena leptocephala]|nr:hypothetical protein B0H13DRAFT_1856509 [Mycena leptocephala]